MVSVGTQTPWSWLSDSRQVANLHNVCELPAVHKAAIASTATDDKWEEALHLPRLLSSPGTRSTAGERLEEDLSLPDIVVPRETGSLREEMNLSSPHNSEEMLLPPRDNGEGEEKNIPLLVSQLSGLEFPSDISSDSSTEDEEEQNIEDEEILPPYPDVQADQLSWPAILQYLRESESAASKYFSLDKKNLSLPTHREVEREHAEVLEVSQGQGGEGFRSDETKKEANSPVVKRMERECDFCGHSAPQWSVLHATTGAGEGMSLPEACCCQFKEYCVLVTACLQQMIAERASGQPNRISVIPKHKKDVKKTAEEKALALMKRRKRWEELQMKRKLKKNKTLQSSSFYSLTKQTKIIQFSLVSQTVVSKDWMTEEKRQGQRGGGAGRKGEKKGTRKRGKGKKEPGDLPASILEMLKKTAAPPRALEVRTYGNAQPLYTQLPDNTGQCFYPSGSVAILIYRHIPGVLSYLMFDDRQDDNKWGSLLCCADELGRTFCYHPDCSLRLCLSVNGEGVMYSTRGEVKKRWRWGGDVEEEEGELMAFQPLSLSLNKSLLLQCSGRDQLLVTFSVAQQRVKFIIPRKLKECSIPEEAPVLSHTETYQHFLSHMHTRLKYLLAALGGTRQRTTKLSVPQAVSSFKTSHSGKQRQRSRSTGTMNLTTHPYPMSSRRIV